jgi:hypothetical protein
MAELTGGLLFGGPSLANGSTFNFLNFHFFE